METRPRPLGLAAGYLVAWLAASLLIAAISGPWLSVYASSRAYLPSLTRLAVSVGEAMRAPIGWMVLCGSFALGLLPLHLGVGGAAYRRWLLLGVAQAVLAALLLWAALEHPLLLQRQRWGADVGLRGVLTQAGLSMAPALVTSVLLQLLSWHVLSRHVFRLPRGPLEEEAARAVIVAVIPALAAALAAAVLVAALRPVTSTALLVAPPLAAAGTAALIAYGVVLWLRLRRTPGEA